MLLELLDAFRARVVLPTAVLSVLNVAVSFRPAEADAVAFIVTFTLADRAVCACSHCSSFGSNVLMPM